MRYLAIPALAFLIALTGCSAQTTPAPAAATLLEQIDRTAEVQAVAGTHVITAIEVEPGRLNIATDIVDPRGPKGSPAAVEAIAICNAVIQLPDVVHVSVFESDGTTFVLYNHPMVGNVCAEI
ncbi:hypothetical protein BH09ACT6_BH09ACT6_04510 [soil metagenome]